MIILLEVAAIKKEIFLDVELQYYSLFSTLFSLFSTFDASWNGDHDR